jgi:hypothetical protein
MLELWAKLHIWMDYIIPIAIFIIVIVAMLIYVAICIADSFKQNRKIKKQMEKTSTENGDDNL